MKNGSTTMKKIPVRKEILLVHNPLKICMHVRGVARTDVRVMREATALVEAGLDVCIVDIETDTRRAKNERIKDVHFKHIIKPEWLIAERSKIRRFIKTVQKLITTTICLYNVSAAIYYAHDINALLPCYIASLLHRKRLVFDAHEMPLYELERARNHRLNRLIIQFYIAIIRQASGIITVSPPIIEEMSKLYAISDITLVRNILPYQTVPNSNRLRQRLNLGLEVRIVLYQGNLQPGRGLETLIQAAKFLEKNIMIVFMGRECGTTSTELRALMVKEGVEGRVKIIPPVPYEELLDWTISADIGAIPYSPDYSINTYVQMPNKLFEYLMVGLPILASPLPAIVDIINTHGVGRVLSSLEPGNVGAEINAMLSDPASLERMKRNALAAAHSDLCWEAESQHLIHCYSRLEKRQK